MKDFMLIYQNGDKDWAAKIGEKGMQEVMAAWGAWIGKLDAQGKLGSGGSPLVFGGKRLTSSGVVTDIAASEFKELVSGYSLIRAADLAEAVELSRDCPIFHNPESIIEIREVMQIG